MGRIHRANRDKLTKQSLPAGFGAFWQAMPQDTEYLGNYQPQTLYVHSGREGYYATLVSESEMVPMAEIKVALRSPSESVLHS